MSLQVEQRSYPDDIGREWSDLNQRAREDRKSPVLVVRGIDWPGRLVVVHESDLASLLGNHAALRSALNSD